MGGTADRGTVEPWNRGIADPAEPAEPTETKEVTVFISTTFG